MVPQEIPKEFLHPLCLSLLRRGEVGRAKELSSGDDELKELLSLYESSERRSLYKTPLAISELIYLGELDLALRSITQLESGGERLYNELLEHKDAALSHIFAPVPSEAIPTLLDRLYPSTEGCRIEILSLIL